MPEPELDPGVGRLARADAPSAPSWRGKRGQQVRRWLERRGRRAVRPPREPGPDAAQVDRIPGYWTQGQHRCRQSQKGNGLRLAGEPSLG